MKKRIISMILFIAMVLTMVPTTVFAADNYNVTIKFMIIEGTAGSTPTANEENYVEKVVTFANVPGTTQLGNQGTVAYTDEGLIKARDFVGWTTVMKRHFHSSADTPLYSPTQTIADVFGDKTTGEITLYAYYDGLFERWGSLFGVPIPVQNANFNKHKVIQLNPLVKDLMTSQTELLVDNRIKKFEEERYANLRDTGNNNLNFAITDRNYYSYHKDVLAYHNGNIDVNNIKLNATFSMNKGVAYVVKSNRVGQINNSEIRITMNIPNEIDVATEVKDVIFNSYIFKIKEVRSGNTILPITRLIESPGSPETIISFSNPNGYKNISFIAIPKNQGGSVAEVNALTAKEYTQDMFVDIPANGNVFITSENAKILAENGAKARITGSMVGTVKWQLYGSPSSATINQVNSNRIDIGYVFPEAIFDKNTNQYGDTDEQIIKEVIVKDGIVGDDIPDDPTFAIDGKEYDFIGWNTKPDGSGTQFTKDTPVLEDIIVYAQWREKLDKIVTFNKNTSQYGDTTNQTYETVKLTESEETVGIKMPANPTFTKDGKTYEFLGWNTKADGTGIAFDKDTPVTEDIIIYAQWKEKIVDPEEPTKPEKIKVIFDKNTKQYGDILEQIIKIVEVEKNGRVGDEMPANPSFSTNTKIYEFLGWNIEADGSGFEFTKDTIVRESIRVYGIWRIKDIQPLEPEIPYGVLEQILFGFNETVNERYDHFKYMFGYPDHTFRADGNMTRAEATAMFNRILFDGVDTNYVYDGNFNDINPDDWYAKVVGYMTKNGFINGYPDGSFKPNQPITRAEFASIASKVARGTSVEFREFIDVKADHWAYEDIGKLIGAGWIRGYEDNSFKPDNEISRAEAVTVANRMLNRSADKDFVDSKRALLENYSDLADSHWAFYEIMEAANGHEYERLHSNNEKWIRLLDIGQIMNTK